jgi:hypothetical protein
LSSQLDGCRGGRGGRSESEGRWGQGVMGRRLSLTVLRDNYFLQTSNLKYNDDISLLI